MTRRGSMSILSARRRGFALRANDTDAATARTSIPARRKWRKPPFASTRALTYAALVILGLFSFFPVYWLLITSVRPRAEVFSFPPSLIPASVTMENYRTFFEDAELLRYLFNSIVVAVTTTAGGLVVSFYAAYSFSKFRYRGRGSLMYLVLAAQMFPQALLLITLYLTFSKLGLLDTYLGLVLSYMTFTLPLSIWLLKGIFDAIPGELLEAATLDGASRLQSLHLVLLPLARPGIVAAGLFTFVKAWDDFILALTLSGPGTRTLPPGLVLNFLGETSSAWPELMAASVILTSPVVIVFIALQRFFVAGLASGAVKG